MADVKRIIWREPRIEQFDGRFQIFGTRRTHDEFFFAGDFGGSGLRDGLDAAQRQQMRETNGNASLTQAAQKGTTTGIFCVHKIFEFEQRM
jgi:hypothetical protein